jgi:hypothetical protein
LAHYDIHRIFAASNKDSIHHLNIGIMKKKTVIILGSVVVVCGAFSSLFVDWPVDFSGASGDIAKATRFSREQASEKLTNMEELLQNDSAFKDGIVAAQVVMQTRAVQFASLVDMSNEVAGGIPAFAEVLKDMNAASKMVENVNNSLAEAGGDLNAALGGEERPDLAQNTINASLAYTTLQKQNKLATRFIETTDKYLATAKADDQLKFVRDQWLEYQQMTAALEGDKESAEALAKKGNLLSGEKALSAMQKFDLANQVSILCCSHLAQSMNVETKLASSIEPQVLGNIVSRIRSAAEVTMQKMSAGSNLQASQVETLFSSAVGEAIKNVSSDAVASQVAAGLANAALANAALANANADKIANVSAEKIANQTLAMGKRGPVCMSTVNLGAAANVVSAFNSVMVSNSAALKSQNANAALCSQIGDVISQTAMGNRPTLGLRAPIY